MRRGRFSALDGPVKNGYTGGVKDCCGRPRPRITGRTSGKQGQSFIRQSGPGVMDMGA